MRSTPLARVVLFGTALVAVAAGMSGSSCGKRTPPGTVYCGPDGQLTSTAPVQSHRSYCVRAFSPVQGLGTEVPVDFSFEIIDDRGEIARDFATVHEKIMHVIVVRHDLTHFQHVHPTFSPGGRFIVEGLRLPVPGPYRLFADFTPAGAMAGPDGKPLPVTVPVDLEADGPGGYRAEELPPTAESATAGGFEVSIALPESLRAGEESRLTFSIRREGAAVTDLEPYLGANGHAVILREGDLAFIHSHALEDADALRAGRLPFMVHFGEPGRYRAFVQFQRGGTVETAAFTLPPVTGASSGEPSGHSMK